MRGFILVVLALGICLGRFGSMAVAEEGGTGVTTPLGSTTLGGYVDGVWVPASPGNGGQIDTSQSQPPLFDPAPAVPEPTTLALVLGGGLLWWLTGRRRSRNTLR